MKGSVDWYFKLHICGICPALQRMVTSNKLDIFPMGSPSHVGSFPDNTVCEAGTQGSFIPASYVSPGGKEGWRVLVQGK